MDAFTRETGYGYLGNEVASGTEIIERLGEEHMKTGKPIVYTSADSVFQIAAHEDVIPHWRAVSYLQDYPWKKSVSAIIMWGVSLQDLLWVN